MARGKVREARVANMGHKGMLMHLVRECPGLEKLEFVMTALGTQSILEAVIPARALKSLVVHQDVEVHGDTIMQMLKHRPTLEELRIHRVGAGCTERWTPKEALPNLRVLDLRNVPAKFVFCRHTVCLWFTSPISKLLNMLTHLTLPDWSPHPCHEHHELDLRRRSFRPAYVRHRRGI